MTFSRLSLPLISRWTENTPAAGDLARAFLANQWDLSAADRTWLTVLSSSPQPNGRHRVEVGIFGCPDIWVIWIDSTGHCNPYYQFKAAEFRGGRLEYLSILPDAIAAMLLAEHANLAAPYARL